MTEEKKPEVFTRAATGLVREFGWIDGVFLNLSQYNIGIVFMIMVLLGSFFVPSADLSLTIIIVAILIIPIIVSYCFFGASMPRSGGDYVFVSRSLGPAIGFSVGLVFFVFLSSQVIGLLSYLMVSFGISPALYGIGTVTGNTAITNAASTIAQTSPGIIIGSL